MFFTSKFFTKLLAKYTIELLQRGFAMLLKYLEKRRAKKEYEELAKEQAKKLNETMTKEEWEKKVDKFDS